MHYYKVHKGKPCVTIQKNSTKSEIVKTVEDSIFGKKYECFYCEAVIENYNNAYKHYYKVHTEKNKFSCYTCQKSFAQCSQCCANQDRTNGCF